MGNVAYLMKMNVPLRRDLFNENESPTKIARDLMSGDSLKCAGECKPPRFPLPIIFVVRSLVSCVGDRTSHGSSGFLPRSCLYVGLLKQRYSEPLKHTLTPTFFLPYHRTNQRNPSVAPSLPSPWLPQTSINFGVARRRPLRFASAIT